MFSDALETDGFNFISGVPVPDSGACNGDYKDGAHTHEQASSGACKDGTNTNGKPFNGACNGADNKDTHANGQSVTPRADIDKGACRSFEPHTLPPDNLSFITVAEAVSRETGFNCLARIRHRQPLQEAFATVTKDGCVRVTFASPQRAVASGQYCVLYVGNLCIGGGVIR
ncbi:MAG: hypothetical protein LBT55_00540 [Clostridiaceae bacterium]|nr:hypothetical protein [Clostridiaceae bacterium]